MLRSAIAPTITSAINDMSPYYRSRVLQGLATQPRVQGRWLGDDGSGCFWVIAGQSVSGTSRNAFRKDPIGVTTKTFGVPAARVTAVYEEWDKLTPQQLARFIDGVREEVARQVNSIPLPRTSFIHRTVAAASAAARELVHA